MHRPSRAEIGSRVLLTRQHSADVSADLQRFDLQRFDNANGKYRILGRSRRSLTSSVCGAWAVLLTALAVATLLSKCFHFLGSWRRYGDGRRRLASDGTNPPEDPDTRAIVDLCLEMDEIATGGFFPALPATSVLSTTGITLAAASPSLFRSGLGQRAPQSGQTIEQFWGWPPQPQILASTHAPVVTHTPATVVTHTPATVAAQTPGVNSPPLYQVANQRGSPGSVLTWSFSHGLGHSGSSLSAAAYSVLETKNPSPAEHFTLFSPETSLGSSAGGHLQFEFSGWSGALTTDQPPVSLNPSPQTSLKIPPWSDPPEPDSGDSDPEEGPSTGLRTLSARGVGAKFPVIGTKRKGYPDASSTTSLATVAGSAPGQMKRKKHSGGKMMPSSIFPQSLVPSTVLNPELHLFYRIPRVDSSAITTVFSTTSAFTSVRLLTVPYYGILALRNFLSKEAVVEKEVTAAIRAAERLVNCLTHFHLEPVSYLRPHEVCRILGMRFLALDALLALSEALGPSMHVKEWWGKLVQNMPCDVRFKFLVEKSAHQNPNACLALRLSRAIACLKHGSRLDARETVELKQSLFCSEYSPSFFKKPKWKPWREDDASSSSPPGD